jgi:protein-disulfide isomerase-like protein with CxxC motif
MAPAVVAVRHELPGGFALDLVQGGINLDSTQVVGSYGRRLMHKLWKEVADTTGQILASLPTDDYVHNALPVCLAVEAVRRLVGHPPFDFLHDLQRRFFTLGENTTDPALLRFVVQDHGLDVIAFDQLLTDPSTRARVQFQFEMAHAFGTHALPSPD